MRIVLITPGGTTAGGGMGTVARSIQTGLDSSDRQTHLTVLDPRGDGPVWASPPRTLWVLLRFIALTLSGQVDIVHLNLSERLSIARKGLFLAWAKLLHLPVIVHHHGAEFVTEYDSRPGPYRWAVRWCVHQADHNLVLGQRWRRYLVDRLGVPGERVSVFYNAIADPGRRERAVQAGAGEGHVVMLANLSPRKGVSDLLAAAESLKNRGRPVRLTLAGGGQLDRYKREAADRGLGALCRFTGWVDSARAAALLRSADLFVLPSYQEGLPMAILEALATGVPVVTTRVGSIPEVLSDDQTCRFVTPGDAQMLAEVIDTLMADPAARVALAANGRALFEQRFQIERYVDRLVTLYAGYAGAVRVRSS